MDKEKTSEGIASEIAKSHELVCEDGGPNYHTDSSIIAAMIEYGRKVASLQTEAKDREIADKQEYIEDLIASNMGLESSLSLAKKEIGVLKTTKRMLENDATERLADLQDLEDENSCLINTNEKLQLECNELHFDNKVLNDLVKNLEDDKICLQLVNGQVRKELGLNIGDDVLVKIHELQTNNWRQMYLTELKRLEDTLNELISVKESNTKLVEALEELKKEAEDLMDFCIDRGYLDNEDLTGWQIAFDSAMKKSHDALSFKEDTKNK